MCVSKVFRLLNSYDCDSSSRFGIITVIFVNKFQINFVTRWTQNLTKLKFCRPLILLRLVVNLTNFCFVIALININTHLLFFFEKVVSHDSFNPFRVLRVINAFCGSNNLLCSLIIFTYNLINNGIWITFGMLVQFKQVFAWEVNAHFSNHLLFHILCHTMDFLIADLLCMSVNWLLMALNVWI